MNKKNITNTVSYIRDILRQITILSGVSDNRKEKEQLSQLSLEAYTQLLELEFSIGGAAKETEQVSTPASVAPAAPKAVRKPAIAKTADAPRRGRPPESGRPKGIKKLSRASKNQSFDDKNPEVIAAEVVKVSRRLPNWVKNSSQFNSEILSTYLRLRRKSGKDFVPEADLANEFAGDRLKKFKLSYNGMKSISKNNLGKVFDVNNKKIYIWGPVSSHVSEFERDILAKR